MLSDRDLNDLLKKVISGGADPTYSPNEVADFRASIPPEPMGEELPKGTKVVFAEEPEVSAPTSAAERMPIVPKVVPVPTSAQFGLDEAAMARAQDTANRRAMAMERGGRELVAGLTRTAVQPVTQRPTNAFEQYVQQQQRKQQQANFETQQRTAAEKTNFERQEAARKAAEDKARDARDFDYRKGHDADVAAANAARLEEDKRHNTESERTARINANKPRGPMVVLGADGKPKPTTYRDQLKADALKPRAGWEPIDQNAPTFRDPAQAKAFDDSVAAMGAIRNHRDHVMHELDALKKAKSVKEADIIVGRLNAQMGALASKLRAAEGLNNTDAANHAIETMLSLQNGSAINWKNVVNEGRLPGIINAAIDSGEANLETIAESNNLRRSKGGSAPNKHESAAGKVTVSNGEETLEIDEGDLAAAEEDGFRRVE